MHNLRIRRSGRCAFTLIELLIVVAIIGILAAIAVPNFMNAQTKAKISKAYSDIRSLAMANEMYALDNGGGYPPESESNAYERPRVQAGLFYLTTPISYIGSIPEDPFVPPNNDSGTPRLYETGVQRHWPNPKYLAYVMFTIGPDGSENGLYSATPFTGAQRRSGQGNTYAASNGLKSIGDIFWYGGNCRYVARLVLDGKTYNGSCPPNFRN